MLCIRASDVDFAADFQVDESGEEAAIKKAIKVSLTRLVSGGKKRG